MSRRSVAIVYLAAQALAFAAWWAMLFAVPTTRGAFRIEGAPDSTLLAFGLADACVVLLSLVAALGYARARAWAPAVAWLVAGAVGYAALYCVMGWLLTGGGAMAVAAMVPAAVCSSAVAALAGGAR